MSAPTVERPARTPDGLVDPRPRRRRRLRILAIVLVVLLLGVGVWLVWFSSVLSVAQVRVVGAEGSRVKAVLAAASVPVGVPLARLDTETPLEAVLALPWVRSAEVRRGWPTEIVIAVTPRVAIASVAGSGKAVDADGAIFDPSAPVPKDLPKVSGEGVGLAAAMAVLSSLPADIERRVVSLSASTRDDVDLTLRSGDLVHWGSADQPDFKAEVLRALMRHKADVYDVTAPELPTTFRAG